MKGRSNVYDGEELAWIEKHAALPRRELHRQFVELFQRFDITLGALNSLCKRKGWMTGRTGCYAPGQTPPNKGQKMPFHPNSAKTRFRKGNKPHTTKYLGHERLSKEGYIEISVAETNPHTGFERRYVAKHRHLWIEANGQIPEGQILKCLDGNKANTDPSNWEAIPRALLPRLSGRHSMAYDTAPAELKPVLLATAKLEHAAREKQRT